MTFFIPTGVTTEALIALALEPLLRRKGTFVRQSEFDKPNAETFRSHTLVSLVRNKLAFVRPRRDPRRIEARLTADGRTAAAYALGMQADQLTAAENLA